jgi:chromosome segregation ATPase
MSTRHVKRFLIRLFLALLLAAPGFAQVATAQESPSGGKGEPEQKSKAKPVMIDRVADSFTARDQRDLALIDVELLTRAENRSDDLRAQLLDLQMKEIDLQARLDDLDYRLRPESIQQALSLVGSVRPMDELRDDLRARLEGEKTRVNAQLEVLVSTRARLEAAISDADAECARLRQRLRLLRSTDGCQEDNGAAPGDGESSSPASPR